MAYFPQSELIASIRHQMCMEDESGTCSRLLQPVPRRAKYGGLPLNFRQVDSEDEEDFYNYDEPLHLEDEPPMTSTVIEGRLRSRTADSDRMEDTRVEQPITNSSTLLLRPRPFVDEQRTSVLSAFLESNDLNSANPWTKYHKYEASANAASRNLLIFCAVDERQPQIQVRVIPSAKVSNVIGVCCLVYSRETGIILSGTSSNYQLLMADETGEIDFDLNPLERSRAIGELGFDVLALVGKEGVTQSVYKVTVYFVTGEQFTFEMPDLDNSLQWLMDEALKKRTELMTEAEREIFSIIPFYHIETADGFDVKLKPEHSIASANSLEFVMVRKNSARNGYHPRGMQQIVIPPNLISQTPAANSDGTFVFPDVDSGTSGPPSRRTTPSNSLIFHQRKSIIPDNIPYEPKEWTVEKLHKYKAKWTARLILRLDVIEISPPPGEKRRSIIGNPLHKSIVIPWEYVCDALATVRKVPNTRELSHVVMIYTLPILDQKLLSSVVGVDEEMKIRHVPILYENSNWKVYTVECQNEDEAQDIESNIQDICRHRDLSARQIFRHSASGARRPAVAADMALLESRDASLSSSMMGTSTAKRKGSKFAGTIRRMLSSNKE